MAVMVDRLDQVAPLKAELDKRKEQAPDGHKPFERVVTIFDLLPDRQPERIVMLEEIVDRVNRAHKRGFVTDAEWTEIEPHLPKGKLVPIGIDELPERMARPFMEKDGTRGRIVYIAPKEGRSIWDGHYLDLWAASFREVRLPNGEVIKGSGRAVIYSDMLHAVRDDAPKAILTSLIGTLLVVTVAFRFRRESWLVLATVLLGVSWLVAFIYLRDIKLNFLNFVALPITFGVGADYAVNMMRRFRLENYENLEQVIVETGGAVVLCSLTTTVGYAALLFSMNKAIRSFGTVAAVGEITTLVAAALVLPSLVYWRKRRQQARTNSDDKSW
jgi:predicted RND superfamily exporter protein